MPHPRVPTDRSTDDVRAWVGPLLARARQAGPVPPLGSPDWTDLDDHDPRKWAAVIRAALAWVSESTPTATARRLRAELDGIDRAVAERLKAAACDLSAAHLWESVGPAHTELARRRATPPLQPLPPFDPVAAARWVATGHSSTPGHQAAA